MSGWALGEPPGGGQGRRREQGLGESSTGRVYMAQRRLMGKQLQAMWPSVNQLA